MAKTLKVALCEICLRARDDPLYSKKQECIEAADRKYRDM